MSLLIILVLGITPIILWEKVITKYDLELIGGYVIAIASVFAFVALVSYSISLETIAELSSFHNTNKFVYEKAVKEFPNSGKAITKNDATTVITLPYDRIKLIADYNKNLTWYHMYQNNWLVGGFVGKVPSDLKFIVPPVQE